MSSPAHRIVELCRTLRCQTATEKVLQDALEVVLRANFSTLRREVKLSEGSTIDFLVDALGVEVKVDGSRMGVIRQIQRYLEHESVDGLVLITTRRQHLLIPKQLRGKSVDIAWLSPF